MSRPFQLLAIVALCILIAGCTTTAYIVEMHVDGDEIERTTEVFDMRPFLRPEAAEADRRDRSATLVTRFKSEVPADMETNAGTYQRWASRLGGVTAYVERFPGDDDLLGQVESLRGTVDRGIDLLIGWFSHELEDEPGWDELRVFLDERLRRDAANAALYLWFALAEVDDPLADATTLMRIGRYLTERGYFEDEEAPRIMRLFVEVDDTEAGARRFSAFLRRLIAERMGIPHDEPIPDALAFLADNDAAEASFEAFAAERGVADEEVEEVVLLIFRLLGFEPLDDADVRFASDAAPTWTNGEWDAGEGRVTWHRLMDRQLAAPAVAYAVWATPDEAFQNERFGEVILSGRELVYYVFWREGLSESEAAEWDGLVDSLEPGEEAQHRLAGFRFSDEVLGPEERSYADHPVRMILERVEGANQE